jgi:hypothetical protein
MVKNSFFSGQVHLRSPTPRVKEASSGQQSKHAYAQVEEVEDEDAPEIGRYMAEYPGCIADTLGMAKTKFEKTHDDQRMEGMEPHTPFADEE